MVHLLLNNVVRLHGLLDDVVSERGVALLRACVEKGGTTGVSD